MKYIKMYEEIDKSEPKVGDYVIVDFDRYTMSSDELYELYINTVGKIYNISHNYDDKFSNNSDTYSVRFDEKNVDNFDRFEIIFYSSNKEECEAVHHFVR